MVRTMSNNTADVSTARTLQKGTKQYHDTLHPVEGFPVQRKLDCLQTDEL